MRRLNPWVAAALGFVFPGGGHIYCGQRGRGAFILTAAILTLFLCGAWNLWSGVAAWHLATRLGQVEVPASPGPVREMTLLQFIASLFE